MERAEDINFCAINHGKVVSQAERETTIFLIESWEEETLPNDSPDSPISIQSFKRSTGSSSRPRTILIAAAVVVAAAVTVACAAAVTVVCAAAGVLF